MLCILIIGITFGLAQAAGLPRLSTSSGDLLKIRYLFDMKNSKMREEYGLPKLGRSEIPTVFKNPIDRFLYQTDMLLSPSQARNLLAGTSSRGLQTDPQGFWDPSTPIPYYFDPSMPTTRQPQIKAGLNFWQQNTCLSFVESQTTRNRLRFFPGGGCWANVGKQYKQDTQDVSISSGCEGLGTVTHEIGHALGFWHTQARPDRDSYIRVDLTNVNPDMVVNFVKNTESTDNNYGMPFDFGSVMMYDPYSFAIVPTKPTVVALDQQFQLTMGQRDAPAFQDVKMMNVAYKCLGKCSSPPSCSNGGYPHPRTCKCVCPKYFSGPTCDGVASGSATLCNGQILMATTVPQQFTFQVGENSYTALKAFADCYWLIKAPAGRKIQLKMLTPPSTCDVKCNYQRVEINLGQVEQYGMTMCCGTSITWTTISNLAAIRGSSKYSLNSFVLQYQAI